MFKCLSCLYRMMHNLKDDKTCQHWLNKGKCVGEGKFSLRITSIEKSFLNIFERVSLSTHIRYYGKGIFGPE